MARVQTMTPKFCELDAVVGWCVSECGTFLFGSSLAKGGDRARVSGTFSGFRSGVLRWLVFVSCTLRLSAARACDSLRWTYLV